MIGRRALVVGLGSATTMWPGAARAQQKAMPLIGILGASFPDDPAVTLNLAAFRQALSEAGFVEGRNVAIEYRWAQRHYDRLPSLAAELVTDGVDVIVTEGGDASSLAAKNATSAIPVVFHTVSDPVAMGLVASLARPGGNLTGVNLLTTELFPKLLQLICELVPQAKTIALFVDPNGPTVERVVAVTQEAATATGVRLHVLRARTGSEIEAAFASLGQSRADALLVSYGAILANLVVGLAARYAIPAIYPQRAFAMSGGLISYGPSIPAAYRIKGDYTVRVLKGAKPADLPVQQPNVFELLVNLKTAKALGLTVPQSFLARVDEVIE